MRHQGKKSDRSLVPFARHLRQASTEAERVMWRMLRNRRYFGVKFRRQVQVGRYIVDFYAPWLRLAIELDGEDHFGDDARHRDEERTAQLETFGVTLIRFENRELLDGSFARRLEKMVMELLDQTPFAHRLRHVPWR